MLSMACGWRAGMRGMLVAEVLLLLVVVTVVSP